LCLNIVYIYCFWAAHSTFEYLQKLNDKMCVIYWEIVCVTQTISQ
jgi:hypothetical protein